MVEQANRKRRTATFAVGDMVWLKTDHLQLPSTSTRKLAPRWVGPFTILQRIGEVSYKLQLPEHWKMHPTFHVSLLKLHHGPARPNQAPVFTVDEGEEFEVEKILQHRIGARDRLQFLVRWVGYDASEDMWLAEDDLSGAARILRAYKRRHGLA
jgi:hypothetical protein